MCYNNKRGIYYWQKNKATGLLNANGVQFPGGSSLADGFIRSVTDPLSNVNRRIENITETKQFIKWFGDWRKNPKSASKVVNADGTPKVMYHGSPNLFTVFDKKRSKSSNLYVSIKNTAKIAVVRIKLLNGD